jgi:Ca2+-transporting ATPase
VAAAKAHLLKEQLDGEYKRIGEVPFSSEAKFMSTLHKGNDKTISYTKGATEVILPFCTNVNVGGTVSPLSNELRQQITDQMMAFSKKAMRVIAVASQNTSEVSEKPSGLTFLGLAAMIDPPRPEAAAAVAECRDAGIKVMMITGDNPVTAEAIAKELGIITSTGRVVIGAELEAMSDAELANQIESIDVCARVSPAHKLRVVTALQAKDHIVAMTGDGVNDAPALKKADIGIAMGITGTDVAKEAADMTLLDDNFASIVAAIEEGRVIFGNIKKYLMYLLSSNAGEIGLMAGTALMGLPLPLSAVQILYVNLATDGLPALALAVDPPSENMMKLKPRRMGEGIFTKPVIALMLTGGIWSTILNTGLFIFLRNSGKPMAEVMTMVFVNLVVLEFLKAYALRSERVTMFKQTFFNKWLNRAVLWELCVLAAVVYLPFLHVAFGTYSLILADLAIIAVCSVTIILVLEVAKIFVRRLYPLSYGR